jgi:hypothetical protein
MLSQAQAIEISQDYIRRKSGQSLRCSVVTCGDAKGAAVLLAAVTEEERAQFGARTSPQYVVSLEGPILFAGRWYNVASGVTLIVDAETGETFPVDDL